MSFSDSDGHERLQEESFLQFSDDEILENYQFVLEELRNGINSTNTVAFAEFALERVLKLTAVEEMDENIFRCTCPAIKDFFNTTIAGLAEIQQQNNFIPTQMSQNEVIDFTILPCFVLLKALQSSCDHLMKVEKLEYKVMSTFLTTLRGVLAELESAVYAIPTARKNESVETLENQLLKLKRNYLLMTQKVRFSKCSDDEMSELETIVSSAAKDVIRHSSTSFYDTNISAEHWKTVVYMLSKYEGLANLCNVSTWVTHLSNLLVTSIDTSKHLVQTDSMLASANYHLKILVQICKINQSYERDTWDTLIRLLTKLFRFTPSYLSATGHSEDSIEKITKNLVIGANPLLSIFFALPEFPKYLKLCILKEKELNPYGCTVLLLFLIKRLFSVASRKVYVASNCSVLDLVYDCFGNCISGVVDGLYSKPGTITQGSPDLYEHVLVTVAAFTLSLSASEFNEAEQVMMKHIIQPEPWKAMLASDVFCVVARYAEPAVCHTLVESLTPLQKYMKDVHCRPEFVYLSRLLWRLYPLCEPEFLQRIQQKSERQEVGPDLKQWLKSSSNDEKFIEKLDALSVSARKGDIDDELVKLVADMWELQSLPYGCHRYLCSLISLTAYTLPVMPPQVLLTVITNMSRVVESCNHPAAKLAVLKIISKVSTLDLDASIAHGTAGVISDLYKLILTSKSPVLQMAGWRSLAEFARISPHTAVIKSITASGCQLRDEFILFLKKILPPCPKSVESRTTTTTYASYDHKCSSFQLEEADLRLAPKKIKMQNEHVDFCVDVNEILERFQGDAKTLLKNSNILHMEQKMAIRSLSEQLMSEFNSDG